MGDLPPDAASPEAILMRCLEVRCHQVAVAGDCIACCQPLAGVLAAAPPPSLSAGSALGRNILGSQPPELTDPPH